MDLISPWQNWTIWLVLMFYIISKSCQFLLKLDLHCKLPNFRHVPNISALCGVLCHQQKYSVGTFIWHQWKCFQDHLEPGQIQSLQNSDLFCLFFFFNYWLMHSTLLSAPEIKEKTLLDVELGEFYSNSSLFSLHNLLKDGGALVYRVVKWSRLKEPDWILIRKSE